MSTSPTTEYTYNIVKDDGDLSSATVFRQGEAHVATVENPNFKAIVAALVNEAPWSEVEDLFDLAAPLSRKFARLSDRVTIENGTVYFDGDEVHGGVVDTIVRFHTEGNESFKPLVAFLDNLGQNPNEHSREHAGRWLVNREFSLDENGFIIAYKGVRKTAGGETTFHSITGGPGVSVNDVKQGNGVVPQSTGDIVTMARSEVEFDPKVACSRGLHVGTWSYARNFASTVVEVRVNPRDIVSVPVDCNDQKMRTCRYEVLSEVTKPRTDLYTPIAPEEPQAAPEAPVPCPEQTEAEILSDEWAEDPAFEVVGIIIYGDDDDVIAKAAPAAEGSDTPLVPDYVEYKSKDFKKLSRETLRAIAKGWKEASNGKVVVKGSSKDDLAKGLAKQAGNIRWNRKRGQGFTG